MAAALLLSAALAAVGVAAMVIASEPRPPFVLEPGLVLLAAYLMAPFSVALLSLGRSRRRATGVRKLILAGLAADIPVPAVLLVALGSTGQSGYPFSSLVPLPSSFCSHRRDAASMPRAPWHEATRRAHCTQLD